MTSNHSTATSTTLTAILRVAIFSNAHSCSNTQLNSGGRFTVTMLFCADKRSCWRAPAAFKKELMLFKFENKGSAHEHKKINKTNPEHQTILETKMTTSITKLEGLQSDWDAIGCRSSFSLHAKLLQTKYSTTYPSPPPERSNCS